MRAIRLYHDGPLNDGDDIKLSEDNTHYLADVLRQKEGGVCILFNGDGHDYTGVIQSLKRRECVVKIIDHSRNTNESSVKIHLFAGIIKSDKMDLLLQKTTELGVQAITPVYSEFCDIKLNAERLQRKMAHWQKVITHAAEQCERAALPTLHTPCKLEDTLSQSEGSTRLYFHPNKPNELRDMKAPDHTLSLWIGPEGGWSEQEIEWFAQNHFSFATLGPRILRAETAAVAAMGACRCLWG